MLCMVEGLTGREDAGQLAGVEDGDCQGGALWVARREEVGVPVLHLVAQVLSRRQEIGRRDAGARLHT